MRVELFLHRDKQSVQVALSKFVSQNSNKSCLDPVELLSVPKLIRDQIKLNSARVWSVPVSNIAPLYKYLW